MDFSLEWEFIEEYCDVYIPRRNLKTTIKEYQVEKQYLLIITHLEWTLCFVTLQTVLMLKQQRHMLKM